MMRQQFGLAMIIVSHDVMFLESLNVDRVIVLHQGRQFTQGTFTAIREDPEVRRLFWGEESIR
jgi:ABC-type branched-subunit amino acid transport system ATPase component